MHQYIQGARHQVLREHVKTGTWMTNKKKTLATDTRGFPSQARGPSDWLFDPYLLFIGIFKKTVNPLSVIEFDY